MIEKIFFDSFVFIFGLCIGSFLNVVILRLEKDEGFVKGRSYCPRCRHQLTWLDLIPVFSFLFLKGRCRYCKAKISWQYPLVEIATGGIFLLIFNLQFTIFNQLSIYQIINTLFLFYIASSFIVIFVYDLKFYLIPDKVLFPAIAVSFVYRLLDFGHLNLFGIWDLGFGISPLFVNYLAASFLATAFFLSIFMLSRGRWMGFGDVKLAILLGLVLGFPKILAGLFLSFFFGAIIGLALMVLSRWQNHQGSLMTSGKKIGLKSELPFAPFLILGTFLAMFFGDQIIFWYTHFLVF